MPEWRRTGRLIGSLLLAAGSSSTLAAADPGLENGLIQALHLKKGSTARVGTSGKAIQAYMREGYVGKRPDYLKLDTHLHAQGVSASNSFKLYNSGLCGIRDTDMPMLEASIRLIDEWTQDSFDIHTIEQVAISFAMRGQTVRESRKFVHHYYADKRFFHAMHAHVEKIRAA